MVNQGSKLLVGDIWHHIIPRPVRKYCKNLYIFFCNLALSSSCICIFGQNSRGWLVGWFQLPGVGSALHADWLPLKLAGNFEIKFSIFCHFALENTLFFQLVEEIHSEERIVQWVHFICEIEMAEAGIYWLEYGPMSGLNVKLVPMTNEHEFSGSNRSCFWSE